jgi:hypothetical protein
MRNTLYTEWATVNKCLCYQPPWLCEGILWCENRPVLRLAWFLHTHAYPSINCWSDMFHLQLPYTVWWFSHVIMEWWQWVLWLLHSITPVFWEEMYTCVRLRFSWQWLWRMLCSGMWHHVDLVWSDIPPKHWFTQDLHGARSQKIAFLRCIPVDCLGSILFQGRSYFISGFVLKKDKSELADIWWNKTLYQRYSND